MALSCYPLKTSPSKRPPVKRKDKDMEIPTLIARLSCSLCGSGNIFIRIIYTTAARFAYGSLFRVINHG